MSTKQKAYTYEELSDTAKQTAFANWIDFRYEVYDIDPESADNTVDIFESEFCDDNYYTKDGSFHSFDGK